MERAPSDVVLLWDDFTRRLLFVVFGVRRRSRRPMTEDIEFRVVLDESSESDDPPTTAEPGLQRGGQEIGKQCFRQCGAVQRFIRLSSSFDFAGCKLLPWQVGWLERL